MRCKPRCHRESKSNSQLYRLITSPPIKPICSATNFAGKDTSRGLALKAMDYFRQAVELDPEFALAHVGLADGYIYQAISADYPQKKCLRKRKPQQRRL